jgi:hypothetical protein
MGARVAGSTIWNFCTSPGPLPAWRWQAAQAERM